MFGSLVAVVATAWLVIVPGELGVMRMVSTTEPPELIEPSWQASSGKAMPHEPWFLTVVKSSWRRRASCRSAAPSAPCPARGSGLS